MSPRSYDEIVLPDPDVAFNCARWLTRSAADAEDIEYLRVAGYCHCRLQFPFGVIGS